jgi:peptide/nickel transport system substrate-binding protein
LEGRYAYDPVEAALLLDQAGVVDTDSDGWRNGPEGNIELLVIIPPWGLMPDVAQLVQSQWQGTLRVKVVVKQVASFPMLVDEASGGNYNAIGLNAFGLDPAFIGEFYRADGVRNWMRYSDSDLDQILIDAESEIDEARRAELYARAQQRIMDNALIVPIRDYVNLTGVRPDVDGMHFDAQGWFPYLVDLGLGS